MNLTLSITTPERLVYNGEARFVVVPAHDGELGILPRHAPLVALLGTGELRVTPADGAGGKRCFFVDGGFVQVLDNKVIVLATEAEPAEAIERRAAEEEAERLKREGPPGGSSVEDRGAWVVRVRVLEVRARIARGAATG